MFFQIMLKCLRWFFLYRYGHCSRSVQLAVYRSELTKEYFHSWYLLVLWPLFTTMAAGQRGGNRHRYGACLMKSLSRSVLDFNVCLRLFIVFIVPTGCPSERRPPPARKTASCYGGIVQGYRTKLLRASPGPLTCSVCSTVTRDLGFKSHPKDN